MTKSQAIIALSIVAIGLGWPNVATCQDFLIPPAFYAVQGAPFTVMIESVWNGTDAVAPGSRTSRVIRDAAGRQRFDLPTSVMYSQVLIYDVVRELVIKLDPKNKTATVSPMSPVGRPITIVPSAHRGFPCAVNPGDVSLGVRWIEGLEACGRRTTQHFQKDGKPIIQVRELWLSTNYLMPLMAAYDDLRFGLITQTVTRLDAGEPDASLFDIPPGYTVVSP